MYAYVSLAVVAAAAISSNAAAARPRASSNCTNPEIRVEWANLSSGQQRSYLEAELCLMKLPAQTTFPNVTNRYTDLVALHQNLSAFVHNDGVFLPWHRYFLHAHNTLLREECGYSGPIPWWDERPDAGHFANASIFSSDTFGTIGGTNNGSSGAFFNQSLSDFVCVTDGYFANTTVYLGPGYTNVEHCLSRNVNDLTSDGTGSSYVDGCNSYDNYTSMWNCSFSGPHGDGHGGVGGVMGDTETSPSDPIFFLHHGFVDRNWWYWQSQDVDHRMYQINGYTTQTEPACGWVETTLDYIMTVYGVGLNDTIIENVMDTEGGYLCYTYDV